MKLLSKKEVQTLRSQSIDNSNLEKDKVDKALSSSIKSFNEWKKQRSEEEYRIEQEFHNKINIYNNQIDDLIKEVHQLAEQKRVHMVPINKILDEAKHKLREAETKRLECERFCKELDLINKNNKEIEHKLAKKESALEKRQVLLDNEAKRTSVESQNSKICVEKLFKDKMAFERVQLNEKTKNDDKLDEIRVKTDAVKAQIAVNKEQKIQNMRDQAKVLSDRQAVNTAWEELKKLKAKYDRSK